MGAMAGIGAGLGIMGGTLGGIGDIIQAHNYKRPFYPGPTPEQNRLRDLVNNQLIGGGQEYLGGMNLLNQMTPMMLGMIPGMSVTPAGGGAGGTAASAPSGGQQDYNTARTNYQNLIGAQQQVNSLTNQLKTMKAGPQKQAARQQLKAAKRFVKSQPTMSQAERDVYQAASTPPAFNFTTAGTGAQSGSGTPTDGSMGPTASSSFGDILGWLRGSGQMPSSAPTAPSQPTSIG